MESFDVSQENFLRDPNIKYEDEIRKYWIEEFYEKKSRLKLFFDRVWYWFIVSLTGILLIGIPVALTIFVVNFLPILLFHMLVEEVILFGVLSTFFWSIAIIGGYYLASVLFYYADKLNDRNNRDNKIDIEKRSPVQRVLAGFGYLAFRVATAAIPVCIVTFYIDIAAIILLILLAACYSSDRNCFVYFNCGNNSFGGLGLWQSFTRAIQTARSCWKIAAYGKSDIETWEKNYDALEKLYLKRLEKVFAINSGTNKEMLNAAISCDTEWNRELHELLVKLGSRAYKETLERQSILIVLKRKVIPLIAKLADKTGKSADEIFAYENVLMSDFSVFDDNERINNRTNVYDPAPLAQSISSQISNDMNGNKDAIKLLKNELLLAIDTSNYLFGAFNQPKDVLKQIFEEYRNKRGYNRVQADIWDNKDMTKNTNAFNVGNVVRNNNLNNRYPDFARFPETPVKSISKVYNRIEDNNSDVDLPSLEDIERAKKNETNVSLSENIANVKSKFENNNLNNQYPSFDEFLETQKSSNLINQNI